MTNLANSPLAEISKTLERITEPTNHVARPSISKIDPEALYRLTEIEPFLPIGSSTWRRMVAKQRAPQPIKLSAKCTLWRGSDILDWLRSPEEYSA